MAVSNDMMIAWVQEQKDILRQALDNIEAILKETSTETGRVMMVETKKVYEEQILIANAIEEKLIGDVNGD